MAIFGVVDVAAGRVTIGHHLAQGRVKVELGHRSQRWPFLLGRRVQTPAATIGLGSGPPRRWGFRRRSRSRLVRYCQLPRLLPPSDSSVNSSRARFACSHARIARSTAASSRLTARSFFFASLMQFVVIARNVFAWKKSSDTKKAPKIRGLGVTT